MSPSNGGGESPPPNPFPPDSVAIEVAEVDEGLALRCPGRLTRQRPCAVQSPQGSTLDRRRVLHVLAQASTHIAPGLGFATSCERIFSVIPRATADRSVGGPLGPQLQVRANCTGVMQWSRSITDHYNSPGVSQCIEEARTAQLRVQPGSRPGTRQLIHTGVILCSMQFWRRPEKLPEKRSSSLRG